MRKVKSNRQIPILADYQHTIALRKALEHNCGLRFKFSPARVAELVDAGDSKSPAARCAGSSPASGTTQVRSKSTNPFVRILSKKALTLDIDAP